MVTTAEHRVELSKKHNYLKVDCCKARAESSRITQFLVHAVRTFPDPVPVGESREQGGKLKPILIAHLRAVIREIPLALILPGLSVKHSFVQIDGVGVVLQPYGDVRRQLGA